ncbi:MAG: GatB/YqeY domain-containing protein [Chloroflexi bacterium]|jgi:uncharacterized protein YqeY|nr:GatB/YqeY domain-containing protein [Chloroflexota bacterium]
MDIKAQLENALKDAMRSKDELRKSTIRMVLASIKMAEVEKGEPLDEQRLLSLIQKEVKSRQETLSEAQQAGREDLAARAQAELDILQDYLPRPFSDEELDALARQAVAEAGASSVREMGQVMKILMPRLQGRATGEQASQAVRKLLQS